MYGLNRLSPFDEIFNFQREVDRLFSQFWSDLPSRAPVERGGGGALQVSTNEHGWRIDVPLPGIDPQHVNVEVAGHTLSIRAEEPRQDNQDVRVSRYEQTLTLPPFLDVDKLSASHKHGLLQLTLPLKDSVKPRRIEIGTTTDPKQLSAA
jgi:HSP20 family protein